MARCIAVAFPYGVTGPQSPPATYEAPTIGDISYEMIGKAVMVAIRNCKRPFPQGRDSLIIVTLEP